MFRYLCPAAISKTHSCPHFLMKPRIIFNYQKKDYAFVIDGIQQKIKTNADKQKISCILSYLSSNQTLCIGDLISKFDQEHLIKKDDKLIEFIEKNAETYDKVKTLPSSQLLAYFKYYNNFSPYSTQHGIKGAEFDNVLVVMDNGNWNKYNFRYYFEKTAGKESIIQRTERIFYVCCSRAKENLIVYYPCPTEKTINYAKVLFSPENVLRMTE